MEVTQIENPRDVTYPFSRELYDDLHVVYQGTSSVYSPTIEGDGFVLGRIPFPIESIQRLIALCDYVGVKGWSSTVVKGLSRHTQICRGNDRAVYFSANFWYARSYAQNRGGETMHNAIKLSAQAIAHLEMRHDVSDELSIQVRAIHSELTTLTANCLPVIYALQVDREWLQHPDALDRMDLGDLVATDVNIACLRSVPVERLLAKAVYINGVESGYMGPQPPTWEEARRFGCDER